MSDENQTNQAVQCGALNGLPPSKAVALAKTVCNQGAQSPTVQGSPVAKGALDDLDASVQAADGNLAKKLELELALEAARKALEVSLVDVRRKARVYERAVGSIANGNGALIAEAGLPSRPVKRPSAGLEPVKEIRAKKGKVVRQAVVSWPEAKGAGSYMLEVNFDPTTPDGPYAAVGQAAANRSRVVTAPAPGAQFLARVAAVGNDGTMSAWTGPILVTAR
jgi:hypothetical protein